MNDVNLFEGQLFPFRNREGGRILFQTHEGRFVDEELQQGVDRILELDGAFSKFGLCHSCLSDWPDGCSKATVSLTGLLDNSGSPPVVRVRLSCASYCATCAGRAAAPRLALVDYCAAECDGGTPSFHRACVSFARSFGAAYRVAPLAAAAAPTTAAGRPRASKAPAAATSTRAKSAQTNEYDRPALLSSPAAARDWATQHRDRLSDLEVDQLGRLDFSLPPAALRLLALALVAVSDWVLAGPQADEGVARAQRGSTHAAAHAAEPVVSLRAALRDWAVAVREDGTVLLYGGVARPSLRSVSVSRVTFTDLLSAPPLRPKMARAHQQALRLQRLAGLLKTRSGRDTTPPWKVPSRELPGRLVGLVAAFPGGGPKGAAGVPAVKGALSAEEILGDLGFTLTQVQQALVRPHAGAVCAQCGGKGAVRVCKTCVDVFCRGCVPCNPSVPLDSLQGAWCCRYCLGSLPPLDPGSDTTLHVSLSLSELDTALSRVLAQCHRSGWDTGPGAVGGRHNGALLAAAAVAPAVGSPRAANMAVLAEMVASQPPAFWTKVVAVYAVLLRMMEAAPSAGTNARKQQQQQAGSPAAAVAGSCRQDAAAAATAAEEAEDAEAAPVLPEDPAVLLLWALSALLRHLTSRAAEACNGDGGKPDALRRRVGLALVRSGVLQCGARLLASCPPSQLSADIGAAAFTLRAIMDVSYSCVLALRRDPGRRVAPGCSSGAPAAAPREEEPGEADPLGEWRAALCDSQLLEHAARVLVRLQEAAAAARAAGGLEDRRVEALRLELRSSGTQLMRLLTEAQCGVGEIDGWEKVCPRPLRGPVDAGEERLLARLTEVRPALTGPCLQYLLARGLMAARQRLMAGRGGGGEEGRGRCYGLEEAQLQADAWSNASASPLKDLAWVCEAAVCLWQLTVSGPRRPGIEQPPTGWLPAADGGPEACAPAGLPFAAVNVYDMCADALGAVLASMPVPVGANVNGVRFYSMLHLMARLVMELPGRQALRRLPGLWRAWAELGACVYRLPPFGNLRLFGILLRMDLRRHQQRREQNQHGSNQQQQRTQQQQQAQEEVAPAAAPPPLPAPEEGTAQARGAAAEGQAAAQGASASATASSCCWPSLRVALDAGFLSAVERLLSRHGASSDISDGCVAVVNHLLRFSGVWPAALAHGSVREIASLIVMLRKVGFTPPRQLLVKWCNASKLDPSHTAHSFVPAEMVLGCLLEQLAAMLLPLPLQPPQPPTLQPPTEGEAGGSGQQAQQGDGDGNPLLAMNNSLETRIAQGLAGTSGAPMQLQWLVRAGGCPAPESPSGRQQRLLAVFAVSQWLPRVLAVPFDKSFLMEHLLMMRWLLAAGLQCMAARKEAGLLPAEEAEPQHCKRPTFQSRSSGSASGGAAAASMASTASAAQRYESWSALLGQQLCVWNWFTNWLMRMNLSERSMSKCPKLSQALDVIEVLAVALPGGLGIYVSQAAAGGAGGTTGASGGASAAAAALPAAAAGSPDTGPLGQALRQFGRTALLAELERVSALRGETKPQAGGSSVGDCGCAGPSGGGQGEAARPSAAAASPSSPAAAAAAAAPDTASIWPPPLRALLSEVLARHDPATLPHLPSPAEALEAVAAAGVRPCGNPACANLRRPSEAALAVGGGGKTCARCKAVWYCSGACYLEHWRAGHGAECGGGSGGQSGGGGGGEAHRLAAGGVPVTIKAVPVTINGTSMVARPAKVECQVQ